MGAPCEGDAVGVVDTDVGAVDTPEVGVLLPPQSMYVEAQSVVPLVYGTHTSTVGWRHGSLCTEVHASHTELPEVDVVGAEVGAVATDVVGVGDGAWVGALVVGLHSTESAGQMEVLVT